MYPRYALGALWFIVCLHAASAETSVSCRESKGNWQYSIGSVIKSPPDTTKSLRLCTLKCVMAESCDCFEYTSGQCVLKSACGPGQFSSLGMTSGRGCEIDFWDRVLVPIVWLFPTLLRLFAAALCGLISLFALCCGGRHLVDWDRDIQTKDWGIDIPLGETSPTQLSQGEKREILQQPCTFLANRFGYTKRHAILVALVTAIVGHWIPNVVVYYFIFSEGPSEQYDDSTQVIDQVARWYIAAHLWFYFWAVTFVIYDLLLIPALQKNEHKLYLGLILFALPVRSLAFCQVIPTYLWSDPHLVVDEVILGLAWNSTGQPNDRFGVVSRIITLFHCIVTAEKSLVTASVLSMLQSLGCLCGVVKLIIFMEPHLVTLLTLIYWLSKGQMGMWTIYATVLAMLGSIALPSLMRARYNTDLVNGPVLGSSLGKQDLEQDGF